MSSEREDEEEWTPPNPAIVLDEYGVTAPKWLVVLVGFAAVLFLGFLATVIAVHVSDSIAQDKSFNAFLTACEAGGNFVINIERDQAECVDADRRLIEVWRRY